MIARPSWLDTRRESLARRLLLLPVSLLGRLYGLGATLHRGAYARGWLRATRLPCRVISVGSLAVGGSGKTPFAAWLASSLHARGARVALLSRGYRRRGRERVVVVSDGKALQASVERAGDEPLLLAAHAPGVPVLVGPHRDLVGRRAVSSFGAEVVVLDDGFHHHRLARDVDLVVLDGRAGLGNGRVLPRGPLREPPRALRRADAVVVIDGPLPEADEARVRRLAPRARRLALARAPESVRPLEGGPLEPASRLHDREVGLVCGIARPASFRRTVEGLGARVVAERSFHDHHRYRPADLRGLAGEAPLWITTEKDAVKILPAWVPDVELLVLRLALRAEEAAPFLAWLEGRLGASVGAAAGR